MPLPENQVTSARPSLCENVDGHYRQIVVPTE